MDPIINFLQHDKLPRDKWEAHILWIKAAWFWISTLRTCTKDHILGLCIHPILFKDVLFEIYEGMCRLHSGPNLGILVVVYAKRRPIVCPQVYQVYVHKCTKCQLCSPLIHQPLRDWPFSLVHGPYPNGGWISWGSYPELRGTRSFC